TTMDPHRSTAAVDRQVYNNVYSKLVDIDGRFGIVPQLAQTWEIKGGGLVYVFKLRRGVKFHDGTEFNAEIVKWNFDRMRDPELASPRRSEIAPVKDVKVVDPFTVEMTLSSPVCPPVVGIDRPRRDDGLAGRRREVQGRFRPQPGRHGPLPLRRVGEGRPSHAQAVRRVLGSWTSASRRGRVPADPGLVGAFHGDANGPDRHHPSDPSHA